MLDYDDLMAHSDLGHLTNRAALDSLGTLIDLAIQSGKPEGVLRALEWCEQLDSRDLTSAERAELDYFWANAWADRQQARHTDRAAAWAWEQPEQRKQIFHLRRALTNPAFSELMKERQCQILTNLGSQLNSAGRFVEALEHWTRALGLVPQFWMAQGNRGLALLTYGGAIYDPGHQGLFLVSAHDDLTEASKNAVRHPEVGYPEAQSAFEERLKEVQAYRDVESLRQTVDLEGHELGAKPEEQSYRRWCLHHRLFLNPLNDLGPHPIAGHDVFMLPTFTLPIGEPPVLAGFFNQMKQEYASARWLYYEATRRDEGHFSDRGVLLYNTLDYPSYALAVEKLKFAYRAAYSIFDKIAFFLNTYMQLGMKPKSVSFSRIWRTNPGTPIRAEFDKSENLPFRGLYWLSLDLFDDEFQEVSDPEARALKEVRDHLEHKYLKVHEMLITPEPEHQEVMRPFTDTLAYSIGRRDFEVKTLRLIKLARAALIYLSLGMHSEERRRAKAKPEGLIAQGSLGTWDDDWKM